MTNYEQEAQELFEYMKGLEAFHYRCLDLINNGCEPYSWAIIAGTVAKSYSQWECKDREHKFSTATVLLLSVKLEEHYRTQLYDNKTKAIRRMHLDTGGEEPNS